MGVAMTGGFIRMERSALDHHLLRDPERFRAWFWMVARACWRSQRFDIRGKTITIERGQFATTRKELAAAFNWSESKTERFLTRLQTEQMIGRKTGQGRTVITICNYCEYNPDANQTGQQTGQQIRQKPDRNRTETGQQKNKDNKDNKGTIKYIEPRANVCPDDFWPEPKPGSKTAKAIAQWSADRLESEVERFIAHHQEKGKTSPNWDLRFTTWALSSYQANTKGKSNGKRHSTGSLSGPAIAAIEAIEGHG